MEIVLSLFLAFSPFDFDKEWKKAMDKLENVIREMEESNQFIEGNLRVRTFWQENDKERVLVLKLPSDTPLDIKIKDHTITVKGEVQEVVERESSWGKSLSTNVYRFQHGPMPLPKDVKGELAQIEKKEGEILIRFPKVKTGLSNKLVI